MSAHIRTRLTELATELRQTLPDTIVSVRAFGSRVRGDHRGDSDLDVLVVVRTRSLDVERAIIDICVAHERQSGICIAPVIKDINSFEREREHRAPFYENIRSEAVAL